MAKPKERQRVAEKKSEAKDSDHRRPRGCRPGALAMLIVAGLWLGANLVAPPLIMPNKSGATPTQAGTRPAAQVTSSPLPSLTPKR